MLIFLKKEEKTYNIKKSMKMLLDKFVDSVI